MIDLHTHILAGLDDGPQEWKQAVQMCAVAYQDGIRTIVATPHILPGLFDYPPHVILEKIQHLQTLLAQEGIAVTILPGSEIHVDPDLRRKVEEKQVLSLNQTAYILLEFSFAKLPPAVEQTITQLVTQGIIPIIAHAERTVEIQKDPNKLHALVNRGAFTQVTAMSLTGEFGKAAQKCGEILLQHNLCHIIASDAHSPYRRPSRLSPGVEVAAKLIGEERARAMVTTIPQAVLKGEQITAPLPEIYTARRSWVFFGSGI
jgi:protein-tyrosine phosphatase